MLSWIELVGGLRGGGYVPLYKHVGTPGYFVAYERQGISPVNTCRKDLEEALINEGGNAYLEGDVFIVRIDSDGEFFPVAGLRFTRRAGENKVYVFSDAVMAANFDKQSTTAALDNEVPIEVETHYVDDATRRRMMGAGK